MWVIFLIILFSFSLGGFFSFQEYYPPYLNKKGDHVAFSFLILWWPSLASMEKMKDLYPVFCDAIRNNIRGARNDQFIGIWYSALTS